MERLSFFTVCVSLLLSLTPTPVAAARKSYIVYLGAHSLDSFTEDVEAKVKDSHHELLGSFLGSNEKAKDAIFYSYTKHINGFAAVLEEEEANEISKHPDVVTVLLDKTKKLHTTRTWEFLGLLKDKRVTKESLMHQARYGEDVIVAHLDTGVWPESASFNDEGLGPIPSRWKGKCATDTVNPVKCNRKLIGASIYYQGYEASVGPIDPPLLTARDNEGHGSHTLSTLGGSIVPAASLYGSANGTAMGGSPKARLASYKVCWPPTDYGECTDSDMTAAFDDAIHDGVDVLSISLGQPPIDYTNDVAAIGSFHAITKGISVICSAGNDGPILTTVSNIAPWIITVAATTLDRRFQSDVYLGNKQRYKGTSLAQNHLPEKKFYPLINAEDARTANSPSLDARCCASGTLDPVKAKGKILVCHEDFSRSPYGLAMSDVVKQAGGAGMIFVTSGYGAEFLEQSLHFLPATNVNENDGAAIDSYISSDKSPTAYIQPILTVFDSKPAPAIANFSSRGPNKITPEILKPDIAAPGVQVLAAYSGSVPPTGYPFDERRVPYIFMSGTSMACPHVAGIVGLLKSLHPDWSPAAIHSAIMTSARTRDNNGKPITDSFTADETTPFSYGAGLVRPNRAMDPGLVYDLTTDDYLNFLCAFGYNSTLIKLFYAKPYSCPSEKPRLLDYNYPSISIPSLNSTATTVSRRVRNVGAPGTYKVQVHISAPSSGLSISVKPSSLTFKKGEEKVFKVTFAAKDTLEKDAFGTIKWSDGVHHVRSRFVVKGSGLY